MISLCKSCNCITKSIKKGKNNFNGYWVCGKCGEPKERVVGRE